MKTRAITAVVLIGLFLPLMFMLPPIYITAVFAILCAVGAWELLHNTKSVKNGIFLYGSCVAAFAMVLVCARPNTQLWELLFVPALYMFFAFGCAVFNHRAVTFAILSKGFLAAIVLPLMFCSVLRILNIPEIGKYIVLMPWVTVWVCDSCAFFVGKAFGKTKLAPYVSPKKTVAGAVGGLLGGVIAMAIYSFVLSYAFSIQLDTVSVLLFGFVGALVGQLGDLSLSVIKREAGIKDYGKIFPGHGGVWDRFDSILFAAPLFEIMWHYFSLGVAS